jgi:hypothetical protein
VAQAGVAQAEVRVEPSVLPIGAEAEVGGKPTTAADAGADVAADAGEAGRWGDDGTPSSILGEHYQMELPQPFFSWSPCGHELRRSR